MTLGKNILKSASVLSSLAALFITPNAFGAESHLLKKFGGTLGVSTEVGRLGNSGMDLQDRTLTAFSLEGLAGYRYNSQWLFGLDLNYRIQPQMTSVSDAGGTNLKGKGWLLGLGAQYRINELWAVQGAVDFTGKYEFDKQTAAGQDDHLHAPLTLRLKAQYFFLPRWTADASANYIRWSKFHVSGADHSEASSQWMVGVGITYHFGSGVTPFVPESNTTPEAVAEVVSQSQQQEQQNEVQRSEIAKVLETEKTEDGYKVKLPSAAFASSKSQMSADFAAKMAEVGAVLAKTPNQKITVKGHTDSSGRAGSNNKLSQERANSVKAALVESGVPKENIQAIGVGSSEPVADNKNPEGRALNRRVEISVRHERLI